MSDWQEPCMQKEVKLSLLSDFVHYVRFVIRKILGRSMSPLSFLSFLGWSFPCYHDGLCVYLPPRQGS